MTILNGLNQKPDTFHSSYFNGHISIFTKLVNQRYFSSTLNLNSVELSRTAISNQFGKISPHVLNSSILLNLFKESSKTKAAGFELIQANAFTVRNQVINFVIAKSISNYISNQIAQSSRLQDIYFRQSLLQSLLKLSKLLMTVSNNTSLLGLRIQIKGKWVKTKTGRKQKILLNMGKIIKDGNNSFISYGYSNVFTKFGLTGVKVWVSFKLC
jgi:hypothetical protein